MNVVNFQHVNINLLFFGLTSFYIVWVRNFISSIIFIIQQILDDVDQFTTVLLQGF